MKHIKCFLLGFVFFLESKINIRRKKTYTVKQKNKILKKHEELKRKWSGEIYIIENSYGYFSVGVQNHFNYKEIGYASYYDWGHITATGEKFSANNYTAAHPYLPIPCVAEVVSITNPKKRIIVKINDRGPFIQNSKVIIDLTTRGAKELGFCYHGLLKVRVRVLIKETMMLSEHGGNVNWDGKCCFWQAVKISKYRKTRSIKKKKHLKKRGLNRFFKK